MCSKDKGGSNKILNKIDITILVLTVLCFILQYFEHIQSDAVRSVLSTISFITGIYSTILLFSKIIAKLKDSSNKNVLAEHKKRDFFSRKASSLLKQFSREIFSKPTKSVRIKTIAILIILLIVMVYCMLIVIFLLLLVLIINHLGE